jgi:arsenate reductase
LHGADKNQEKAAVPGANRRYLDANEEKTIMILYGLKTCDTCRKALKSLPDARFVDVRADGVPEPVMRAALAQFGDALVNTRSTTWRGLDASERARPAADLLAAHPTLMKRPLIAANGTFHLGWTAQVQNALGVSGRDD